MICMKANRSTKSEETPYYHTDVPIRVIRAFARRVVERFHPDKIILFGSYAYGTPNTDSDVDILVVMPAYSELRQAFRISQACEACFPLDIIVRTPENMRWRLAEGDSFLREITARGKVLYEKADEGVGAKGGGRLQGRRATQPRKRAPS
jgi:predicted nucleotidyltransferase